MFSNFFPKIVPFVNVEKCGGAREATNGNMAHARCMLNKQGYTRLGTHTHRYIILIAFAQQQWFREGASVLRYTYIGCIVTYNSIGHG